MKINLIKTDNSEARMGHGVLFYFSESGQQEKIPAAFLDGYEWLHGKPESVDVLLFALEPAKVVKIGRSEAELVNEVMDFVNKFLESKGKIKGSTRVSTLWNA